LIFKEELIPAEAYKIVFVLAPIITVIPALVILAVLPWGTSITLFGREISLYLTDIKRRSAVHRFNNLDFGLWDRFGRLVIE